MTKISHVYLVEDLTLFYAECCRNDLLKDTISHALISITEDLYIKYLYVIRYEWVLITTQTIIKNMP